ncbi:hypothetical protein [Halovenus marina]|uniref:hypothetical protein n=1 Tax=Halovenus marina TaxID=3396621 RepID=UPI003F542880
MVEADDTMRAGRNAFLVLVLALLGAWAGRLLIGSENDPVLFGLWALGAAAFYASKYYYRQERASHDREADESD